MSETLSRKAQLKIEYRAIGDLTPYAGNARKHPKHQIRKIAQSLRQFGWTNPIIIDGADTVICGHGRLEAAKLNGEKRVSVIPLEHLSEADRKAYIIADNRIAEEAEWSKATLRRTNKPSVRPTELYQSLMISSGGLTDRLRRLEEAGMIDRVESEEDKRSKRVGLTEKGKCTIDQAFADDMKVERGLLAGLTEDEQNLLADLLAKLLATIE